MYPLKVSKHSTVVSLVVLLSCCTDVFPSELVFAEFRTVSFTVSGLFRLLRCRRLSPFVFCCLVDMFDISFEDFARRLVVDGLLCRVDKPACRPLLLGTWSSFATTFLPLLYLCLRVVTVHSSSVKDDVVPVLT